MVRYIPDRCDIIWLEFDPQKGREIQKTRPALTISPLLYNKKTSLGLFMPITSQIKNYPFEIIIQNEKIHGAILADQMRSLDWSSRNAQFICKIPNDTWNEVMLKFKVLLD